MTSVLFVTFLVFALILQAAWLALSSFRDREGAAPIARRVTEYTDIVWESKGPDAASIRRHDRYSRLPWLDSLLHRFNLADSLSDNLLRAGVPMRAGEFVFIQLVTTTLAGFLAFLLLPGVMGGVGPALAAGLLGFFGPVLWLRMKRGKRLKQFEQDLPDALELISSSLRAGYGVVHGFDIVARENGGPCGEEFGQVLQEVTLGAELDAALARINDRVDSEDARLLATAVAVQRRTGGNLVDVLTQMAHVLRERQRLRREVQVITTAPRVSGYVVSFLPVALMIGMYFLSRYYLEMLFDEPIGRIALVFSAVLVVIGLTINRRIASVEM
ncbi:MAG: type II secretion system F family protein [Chloroflexi bacterium]|nr:type II secretion system F family protein [Chloroflexota bacterium]